MFKLKKYQENALAALKSFFESTLSHTNAGAFANAPAFVCERVDSKKLFNAARAFSWYFFNLNMGLFIPS